MKHPWHFLLAAAVAIIAVPRPGAQMQRLPLENSSPAPTFSFGPVGTAIPAKPHAPFSGVMVERLEQTLNDGTNIARESHIIVMRDSMGRVYRGRKMELPGHGAERLIQAAIVDPVGRVQYLCSPVAKMCRTMEYQPSDLRRVRGPGPLHRRDVTVEDLGSSNISGVDVEGKRVTRVVAEGAAGNDRPFTTTEEMWHSKELDVDVQLKRVDPRMGTRSATLTEVSVGEPDPSYFQVPDGYRVEKWKPPREILGPLSGVGVGRPAASAPPNQ